MKKIHLILLTVFLNLVLFSCTPTSDAEINEEPLACCGDGGNIKPK